MEAFYTSADAIPVTLVRPPYMLTCVELLYGVENPLVETKGNAGLSGFSAIPDEAAEDEMY